MKNDNVFLIILQIKDQGYHCKSANVIFAWRVTWNYEYIPFTIPQFSLGICMDLGIERSPLEKSPKTSDLLVLNLTVETKLLFFFRPEVIAWQIWFYRRKKSLRVKIDPLFSIALFTINCTAVYLRNVNNTLCEPHNIYFSFLPKTAVQFLQS